MKLSRVLLKLSGEQFGISNEVNNDKFVFTGGSGFNPEAFNSYAEQIKVVIDKGISMAIVIGGGNIFRGRDSDLLNIERTAGDNVGMLSTFLNALILKQTLNNLSINSTIFSSIFMPAICELYTKEKVLNVMKKGTVAIFAGGLGHPYFSTDTVAALRAIEIEADLLLKSTKVDGIYSSDPKKDKEAKKYDEITYEEYIAKGLKVMDMNAVMLCKEQKMKVFVFDGTKPKNIPFALTIESNKIGTLIK